MRILNENNKDLYLHLGGRCRSPDNASNPTCKLVGISRSTFDNSSPLMLVTASRSYGAEPDNNEFLNTYDPSKLVTYAHNRAIVIRGFNNLASWNPLP